MTCQRENWASKNTENKNVRIKADDGLPAKDLFVSAGVGCSLSTPGMNYNHKRGDLGLSAFAFWNLEFISGHQSKHYLSPTLPNLSDPARTGEWNKKIN